MALNKDTWAQSIVTALKALNPEITGPAETALLAAWTAIKNGDVQHITGFAVVSTSVSVASVSGVTAGAAASGPGTGTGTGGIS